MRLGKTHIFVTIFIIVILQLISNCHALDYITVRRGNQEQKLEGRIIAEDVEGNLVLEERSGIWFKINKKESNEKTSTQPPIVLAERSSDQKPFVPMTQDEMAQLLKEEFPEHFQVLKTERYLVVYDTSLAYARWCASMLERLHTAFYSQWERRGLKLQKPEFPLVAVLFADRKDFILFVKKEVDDIGESIAAYYNFNTNRIVFSDLTGYEKEFDGPARLSKKQAQIFLSRPGAAQSISSFVHEATHQIAFNSGMHKRYSSCPLWLSEGIAMCYETPDFTSTKGWNAESKINYSRLEHLLAFMAEQPRDAVGKIVRSDDPLRKIETIHSYYATSWALVYYLQRQKPKEFIKYMQMISEKESFVIDSEEKRMKEFEEHFGDDWNRFYQNFTKFIYNM